MNAIAKTRTAALNAALQRIAPGLLVAGTVAAAARFMSEHYGAPAMLFALLIGIAFHFLHEDRKCGPGIDFASTTILKLGVALLGARVTFAQIASLGYGPVVLVISLIILTIFASVVLARLFSKPVEFGLLLGGAVAICGASAALALASVLPTSDRMRRDTLFTVVAVTALSTVAMIAYPIFFNAIGFDDAETGVLIGATIHDVAQVVGAGFAVSDETGEVATYVKLLRVACLPVVVLAYALLMRGRADGAGGRARVAPPWFAVAFVVILCVNSAGLIPAVAAQGLDWVSRWFLIAAIAALGVKTSLKSMADLGASHIGLAVAVTVVLFAGATVSLMLF